MIDPNFREVDFTVSITEDGAVTQINTYTIPKYKAIELFYKFDLIQRTRFKVGHRVFVRSHKGVVKMGTVVKDMMQEFGGYYINFPNGYHQDCEENLYLQQKFLLTDYI